MPTVYHLMPRKVVGEALKPLNQLKTEHPDLYEKYSQKYQGREQATERRIPMLGCLWNDVVFFSNVHPEPMMLFFSIILDASYHKEMMNRLIENHEATGR